MQLTTLALLILLPLLVWRVYLRLRQIFVRQESLVWRHRAGFGFFGFLLLAAAITLRADMLAVSSLGAGVLAGAWLAFFALKKTRIETVGKRYFFKPYDRFGILVCMLFAARVLQVFMEIYLNRQSEHPQPFTFETGLYHPLSCLAFGLLAGYLANFSLGMLRWRRAQPPLPELQ
jgi:hypothetical protein